MSITTKQRSAVVERIEYTYDSEDNRTSKKVTNAEGERFEFYYYDSNGELVSVSRHIGEDLLENTMNFYRDASGKLLNFEYKGTVFDSVFNQRGDVVGITDEVQEVIARYSYDEWGNLIALEGLTPIGLEVAEENLYRYVGHYGVQYDSDNGLYFMGWRHYDAKIGRFIVADEYGGTKRTQSRSTRICMPRRTRSTTSTRTATSRNGSKSCARASRRAVSGSMTS